MNAKAAAAVLARGCTLVEADSATGATAFSSDACSPRFGWKRSAGSLDRAMTSAATACRIQLSACTTAMPTRPAPRNRATLPATTSTTRAPTSSANIGRAFSIAMNAELLHIAALRPAIASENTSSSTGRGCASRDVPARYSAIANTARVENVRSVRARDRMAEPCAGAAASCRLMYDSSCRLAMASNAAYQPSP